MRERIAHVLGFPPARIETSTPLDSLGFDSLNAVELKTRLEADLELSLPVTVSWGDDFTVASLARELAQRMKVRLDNSDVGASVHNAKSRLPETESDQIANMLEETERSRLNDPSSKA